MARCEGNAKNRGGRKRPGPGLLCRRCASDGHGLPARSQHVWPASPAEYVGGSRSRQVCRSGNACHVEVSIVAGSVTGAVGERQDWRRSGRALGQLVAEEDRAESAW